ncbi:MAG TPA: 4Fe-4S dicluster domain-containing protein [Steroidobacteraceae bacterium]|jgi:molybdopterin-containing oxidoreductase family iron-sulfur binding subunit|nr:4Fe-4S dicluster domain-containing protein [Steroidobacteraceae bacterium]
MFDLPPVIDRRECMKLMGAALALGSSSCARPPLEQMVPYLSTPEGMVPGEPLFFATALTRAGYAHGVLIESNSGRPTKIEGNPAHPASLGATGAIEQGRILELWDPERSRAPLDRGQISSWASFNATLLDPAAPWRRSEGEGLRILSGRVSSPTLLAQRQRLLERYPHARWHEHEPAGRESVYAGTQIAFGRPLEPLFHFDRAAIIVSLDADFLAEEPGQVRYAREFAAGRRPERGTMSRLYVAECMPSLTGVAADERMPCRPSEVATIAQQIAARLDGSTDDRAHPWLRAVVADLRANRGRSLVLAGAGQPAHVHALTHYINGALGNLGSTVEFIAPGVQASSEDESIAALARDMHLGRVDTLLILDSNPLYDAPADLEFASVLERVRLSVHHGLYVDETAQACRWHAPAAHELEAWSDARAFDGTITLQQPLIAPLYGGRSAHELLGLLSEERSMSAHDAVRATWLQRFGAADFAERWRAALRLGVVEGTAARAELVSAPTLPPPPDAAPADSLELLFRPDPTLWDGRYAPIAWLQELPKPLTQLTWDNAALISAQLAAQLGVRNEELIELSIGGRRLAAPVWIVPGHAPGAVTLHLGYGRTRAGPVGSNRGINAYALRTSGAPWYAHGLSLRKLPGRRSLATVQHHHRMEGREIVRSATLATFRERPDFAQRESERQQPSLYPPFPATGYAWGMSIDLSACIGCGACTIACQAENNIPTVGKEEVLRGREMHWIRVDRYEESDAAAPRSHFQPVPCMQCEHAPCELVCPVEASVHDTEGINVQVYNRCVGTRFCSNNCPYKVRRFNFFQYSRDEPHLNAQRNPQVTVRMRGVMEKCNYCLQRIIPARISADRDKRRLHDGEVVTACQAVCPTQAIVFGDLNDPASAVRAAKASARSYALLGELNTRPRTTYLAKVVNEPQEREA